MDWQEAIKQSSKGTCKRVTFTPVKKIHMTTIRYEDGSGYVVVGNEGKVDYFLSHPATEMELNGFNDWEPSK